MAVGRGPPREVTSIVPSAGPRHPEPPHPSPSLEYGLYSVFLLPEALQGRGPESDMVQGTSTTGRSQLRPRCTVWRWVGDPFGPRPSRASFGHEFLCLLNLPASNLPPCLVSPCRPRGGVRRQVRISPAKLPRGLRTRTWPASQEAEETGLGQGANDLCGGRAAYTAEACGPQHVHGKPPKFQPV